ncbi:hypothetical protein GCM10027035_28180 [Emticicia sediminis]
MRINQLFIGIILIVLIGECFTHDYIDKDQAELWSNNLRIISWILMGVWFYQLQKGTFEFRQWLFLFSIILPVVVSLISFLLPEPIAIIVNICINTFIFLIWIYYFHAMGAKISFRDSDNNFQKIIPAFLIFPLSFYFFSLYEALSGVYSIIVFIYTVIFSYTGILSVFLPVGDERRLYIILGLSLLVVANILNAYHTFLEKLFWAYPVVRAITVASKCMFIYGIADFRVKKDLSFNQNITNVEI